MTHRLCTYAEVEFRGAVEFTFQKLVDPFREHEGLGPITVELHFVGKPWEWPDDMKLIPQTRHEYEESSDN